MEDGDQFTLWRNDQLNDTASTKSPPPRGLLPLAKLARLESLSFVGTSAPVGPWARCGVSICAHIPGPYKRRGEALTCLCLSFHDCERPSMSSELTQLIQIGSDT